MIQYKTDSIEIDEIVYCDITIETKIQKGNKTETIKKTLEEVVYKEVDGLYKGNKVLDIKVLARLGFANKNLGYTEVKRSEETRNKITGAYD
jgi:flagellar basal body L-ring protein FlgH